ncbi:hypothetical protein Tco_0887462 [Tanacetum coccineum]
MEVIKQIDLNKNIVEDDNDLESKKEDVMKEDAYIEAIAEEMTGCMKTPKANRLESSDTSNSFLPVDRGHVLCM